MQPDYQHGELNYFREIFVSRCILCCRYTPDYQPIVITIRTMKHLKPHK